MSRLTATRPRLGVDFHTFDGIFQGSRSHLLGLYQEAVALTPEIDFLFFLADPARLRREHPAFDRPNVTLVPMPAHNGAWRLLWQLRSLQRAHRLDLLHVQYRLPLWPAGPCACTIHDVLFETHPRFFSRSFAYLARWSSIDAVRRARALLTVSLYSRDQIARLYGLPAHRITVTANGVNTARFQPCPPDAVAADTSILARWGLQPGGYLCTVGRLEPRKNHLNLIEAYAALGPGQPPLVIVGQRDFAFAAAFEAVGRLGLADRVRFLEDVDDAALPVLIRQSRLFAYPSWAEGFGMPVIEAMACGTPVVCSQGTALSEVADGVAWMADPASPDDIARALRAALDECDAQRHARIRAGLERAAQYNWPDAARALLAAFRPWLTPQA